MTKRVSDDAACSFCGKGPAEVARLVAGPNVWICDGCVRVCYEIITRLDQPASPEPYQADPVHRAGPADAAGPVDGADPIMDLIIAAQSQALHGERVHAREAFDRAWAQVGDDGDALHRVMLAHYVADLQDDPSDELAWDRRALAAASELTDERAQKFHPALTVRGLYASLHLNLAADHEKLGQIEESRSQLAAAEASIPDLPADGYGDLIRSGIDALRARLDTA